VSPISTDRLGRLIASPWQIIRELAGSRRTGFAALAATGRARSEWVVGPDTDACIDGFPRSGNSFAVRAFRTWNPDASVAHHVHAPMQAIRAVEIGVPCAVVIRPPTDAVTSWVIFSEGRVGPGVGLWCYAHFYRQLMSVREQLAVVRFEDLVEDTAVIVDRLNRISGSTFRRGSGSRSEREALLASLRSDEHRRGDAPTRSSAPDPTKQRLKAEVRDRVLGHRRLAAANRAYEQISGDRG
jgi:hypothetical protein